MRITINHDGKFGKGNYFLKKVLLIEKGWEGLKAIYKKWCLVNKNELFKHMCNVTVEIHSLHKLRDFGSISVNYFFFFFFNKMY